MRLFRRSGPRTSVVRVLALVGLLTVAVSAVVGVTSTDAEAALPTGLHVRGNQVVDGAGDTVVLRGVNRAGTEYLCVQGHGIFDGPSDAASIAAMASWDINAVRVPLNEDCWLGVDGAPAAYSGAAYRTAITAYVQRLHAAGLVAVLDLHWTAAGGAAATEQRRMPDADRAPAFWTSVARQFANDRSTVFDLFNEPHDVSWTCWRDGGDCGIGYEVAGMQALTDAVRATGARNLLLATGLAYGNDLTGWLDHRPRDPADNLAVSWHSYDTNACRTAACWTDQVAPVAAAVPVLTAELGEFDCGHSYLDALLPWLDAHGIGYLAWGWNTFDCSGFPSLISDYADGTPTDYGEGFRDHLPPSLGSRLRWGLFAYVLG